jgi:hypothetical protein
MFHLYYLKRHCRSSHPYTFNIFHKDIRLFKILFELNFLLHVAYCIISLLLFLLLKFTYIILSRLFQHVMSSTYEHVLFNWAPHSYVYLVQKIINKGATQLKMWVWKKALAFIMWKTTIEWLSFHNIHGTQFLFLLFQLLFLVLLIINFFKNCDFLKLYKYYVIVVCTKCMREQMTSMQWVW